MNFNFYIEGNSFLHKVNPGLKYVLLIIFFVTLAFTNMRQDIVYIILIQFIILLNGLPIRYINRQMLFIIPMTIFVAFGLLFYPLLPLSFALLLAMRLYIILSLVLIINMTTPIVELLGLFSGMIKPVVSNETRKNMTMIFLLVINFIPLILGEISKINQSLRSRHITIKNRSMNKNLFYLSSAVSALVNRLDVLIDEYELVFYARNINVNNVDNLKQKKRLNLRDCIFTIICVVCVMTINILV